MSNKRKGAEISKTSAKQSLILVTEMLLRGKLTTASLQLLPALVTIGVFQTISCKMGGRFSEWYLQTK